MARFRLIASAIAIACVTAATFTAVHATPASAELSPCANTNFVSGQFNRCTSTSPNGTWVGVPCTLNHNYNANSGWFNVIAAINKCNVRVWLHEYIYANGGYNHGWSYCIAPVESDYGIPAWAMSPENIYVSSNVNSC